MLPQEIIRKKRDKHQLSAEEISYMVAGFVSGRVEPYQMSAFLMAIFLNGMNSLETNELLQAVLNSGFRYHWVTTRPVVDKHSTGGVGDKTSFIILPLLIADGMSVPMVAGRALGHTGGTLDKLDSLPGFNCHIDRAQAEKLFHRHHGFFGAQSAEFVPADKKLYALRDVTATVESIPLIVASIMSKKLGEGLGGLVLDVKHGSGAFMANYEAAKHLAQELVAVGKQAGCKVTAALTNMDEPLGRCAGNSVEISEILDVLSGAGPLDTREVSLQLAAGLGALVNNEEHEIVYARMKDHLLSGRAYECFLQLAVAQGADLASLERRKTDWIFGQTKEFPVYASHSGFVHSIHTRELGVCLVEMGGGRMKMTDVIKPCVGFTQMKKCGEFVDVHEPLCFVHLEQENKELLERIRKCFVTTDNEQECRILPLVSEWMH